MPKEEKKEKIKFKNGVHASKDKQPLTDEEIADIVADVRAIGKHEVPGVILVVRSDNIDEEQYRINGAIFYHELNAGQRMQIVLPSLGIPKELLLMGMLSGAMEGGEDNTSCTDPTHDHGG